MSSSSIYYKESVRINCIINIQNDRPDMIAMDIVIKFKPILKISRYVRVNTVKDKL